MPVRQRSLSPPLSEISSTFTHAKISSTAYTHRNSYTASETGSYDGYSTTSSRPSKRPRGGHSLNTKYDRMILRLSDSVDEASGTDAAKRSSLQAHVTVTERSATPHPDRFQGLQQAEARLGSAFGVLKRRDGLTHPSNMPHTLTYAPANGARMEPYGQARQLRTAATVPEQAVPDWLTSVFADLDPNNPLRRLAPPAAPNMIESEDLPYEDPCYDDGLDERTFVDSCAPALPADFYGELTDEVERPLSEDLPTGFQQSRGPSPIPTTPQILSFSPSVHLAQSTPLNASVWSPLHRVSSSPVSVRSPPPAALRSFLHCPKPHRLSFSQQVVEQWSSDDRQSPALTRTDDVGFDAHTFDFDASAEVPAFEAEGFHGDAPAAEAFSSNDLIEEDAPTVLGDDSELGSKSTWPMYRFTTGEQYDETQSDVFLFSAPIPFTSPDLNMRKSPAYDDIYGARLREFASLVADDTPIYAAQHSFPTASEFGVDPRHLGSSSEVELELGAYDDDKENIAPEPQNAEIDAHGHDYALRTGGLSETGVFGSDCPLDEGRQTYEEDEPGEVHPLSWSGKGTYDAEEDQLGLAGYTSITPERPMRSAGREEEHDKPSDTMHSSPLSDDTIQSWSAVDWEHANKSVPSEQTLEALLDGHGGRA